MEANIINVGNSKGIIIPSKILKLLGFNKKVNISIKDNKIIISPIEKPVREGWEEMIINEIEINGHSEKLIPDFFDDESLEDWAWK